MAHKYLGAVPRGAVYEGPENGEMVGGGGVVNNLKSEVIGENTKAYNIPSLPGRFAIIGQEVRPVTTATVWNTGNFSEGITMFRY